MDESLNTSEETDDKEKWDCEYCTYRNFAKNQYCAMCKGKKPLLNEDIFRLSPSTQYPLKDTQTTSDLILPSPPSIVCSPTATKNTRASSSAIDNKWECGTCTYLNWARAQNCIQCNTKVPSNIPSTAKLQEKVRTLSIRDSNPDLTTTASNLARLTSISPYGSCTNLSKSASMAGGAARLSPTTESKWTCPTCTYENWPRSVKCAMCQSSGSIIKLMQPQPRLSSPKQHKSWSSSTTTTATSPSPTKTTSNERLNITTTPTTNTSPERAQKESQINYDDCAAGLANNNKRNNLQNLRYQLVNNNSNNNNNNSSATEIAGDLQQQERRMRQISRRQADWQWLNACVGVVDNNLSAVEDYLARGGNPGRALTKNEVTLLNRSSAFDVGHTLVHLAIRFHREEMLPTLLAQLSGNTDIQGIKRVPSYIAPDLASDIRRHFAGILRIRKGAMNCHYILEHATFSLPAEVEELPIAIQEQLYDELLDRDAQKQLETPPPALNWSLEITARLGSRLVVLWNRSAGDCLLDSVLQCTWGVFDRDNSLRRSLADSLHQCGHLFYPRWKEYEMLQAALLGFTLEENQWQEDWSQLLSLANQKGSSLEQLHIFILAHIMRRPIIVYGVKSVKSFRGEDIGYARFEGLYLPLLWDQSFCIRSPIAMGYTRGHFSALVSMESYSRIDQARNGISEDVTFLPLMDCEHKLLPIHFLTKAEMGCEEVIMRQWMDVCLTEGELLVSHQKLHKRPLLVAQMLEEWLNHYRRIAQVFSAPFSARPAPTPGGYCNSDGDDSDDE